MKASIKHGGGSDIRSPVYPQMGSLARIKGKRVGMARSAPRRGQAWRSKGR